MAAIAMERSTPVADLTQNAAMEGRIRGVLVDVLLIVAAVVVLHLSVSGPIPSGGDGGNWLALARELRGEAVMSADVTYEPVFIGLLAALIPLLGPLGALVVGAIFAEVVLLIAVYVTARGLGRWPALLSVGVVMLLGYRLEAYAWGAYPQMLGLGLGLLTMWSLLWFVDGRRRAFLVAAVVGGLLTFLTHKLVAGLLLAGIPAAAAHLYWQRRWTGALLRRAGIGVGVFALLGAGFVWSWWSSTAEGVEPTLNPLGLTLAEQVSRVFLGSEVPWIVLGILALIGLGMRSWPRSQALLAAAGFGWLASSVAAFVVTGEARTLIQAQVALVPVAMAFARRRLGGAHVKPRRSVAFATTVALAALYGSLAITGLSSYEQSADWYRVVGRTELSALDELASIADDDALAVSSRGPNGNPIGWWVQGYAGIPTYTSVDLGFLAFPDEREQSQTAAVLFDDSPERAAGVLMGLGADYLIFDRRGPDSGWLAGGEPTELDLVTDGTLMILEVPDGA
jgi:hypothetical protein